MFTVEDIKTIIAKVYASVNENIDYLGELDGKSGDGDLGISMEAAFKALYNTSEVYDGTDIGVMLLKLAKDCNKAAPSTMGTLIASGIMALAKYSKGKNTLNKDEIVKLPRIFAEAIMSRGKAKLGDKTILDALLPLCDAVETTYAQTSDLKKSFENGAEAAENAAEATRGMRAKIGRAKWLGERAAEHTDAGAVLCTIIAKALV